jgi:D-alanyl-D-alanine carboxypeptidase/D-alanyl-D-alanine-endopeptidase (penicillin-binding protein 4)
MKRLYIFCSVFLFAAISFGQPVSQKLQRAYQEFESGTQLKNAISSFYVIDAKSGKVIFDKNSQVGLAPASTQKIITSVTAFELLGKDFRYKTELGYQGKVENGLLNGSLIIAGTGDPTLGSWRFPSTRDSVVVSHWIKAISDAGIRGYETILSQSSNFSSHAIPDGWIWQDIGNYYGAGASGLNWRENQFDIILKSENELDGKVSIVSTVPSYMARQPFNNELKAARKGSGDNAYVYFYEGYYYLAGTIPMGESRFSISAAMKNPSSSLTWELSEKLTARGIKSNGSSSRAKGNDEAPGSSSSSYKLLATHYSPSLDSIIYWFNKKSINLYGEALVKAIALEKKGIAHTDSGLAVLRKFWKERGIDNNELNMYDGSGLSPLNRVTTHCQVEILKYARGKEWYPYFFDALPEYNGMKVKSGTITDVKGFCGYHKSADGNEYIFSFLVNNYNGPASALVSKMYKVMDVLK